MSPHGIHKGCFVIVKLTIVCTFHTIMGSQPSQTMHTKRTPGQTASRLEQTHGIYDQYIWRPDQIVDLVRHGKVTPLYQGTADPDETHPIMCNTCYFFYPKINHTSCCSKAICTECLAAMVDVKQHKRKCPFCRSMGFAIVPNVNSQNDHQADEEEYQRVEKQKRDGTYGNEQKYSQKVLDLSKQTGFDPGIIEEYLNDGVSPEEILHQAQH